jgi:MFS family permease
LGEALRDRRFWWLYAATFTGCLGLFIPFVHLVPYALDHGIERGVAVWLIGLIGVGSTVGRFFLGGMADRMGRRQAFSLMFIGMAISMVLWFFGTGAVMLGLFALVFGLAYGGFVALAPALIADYFGARDISGIIGWLYSSVAVGTLAGPSLAGVAYDVSGSYAWPIILSAAFSAIAAAMIFRLPEPVRA